MHNQACACTAVPLARPRARVSGFAASTLRRLRGARPMRSPGALCRGLSAFQNSLSDRPVAGLLLFKIALFDRPAADLLPSKTHYITARYPSCRAYRPITGQSVERMKYLLTHTTFPARPGLRPVRPRPCAACAARAPCGRRARSAADCLPSKIPCLTARLRTCLFSKFLV